MVQLRQDTLNSVVMKKMDILTTEQEAVITLMDCLSSNVYGMVVSNGFFTEKFYFNITGEVYNVSPMLTIDGHFIDGKQASITCYDIIQSEASSLDLSCDNVTNIEQEVNDDATLIKNVFTADIKDNDTICRCTSNKSNSESMLHIHIFPYKGHNVSHGNEVCESNSEIKLTCQDENLRDVFHFGKWIHHYNNVEIRQLDGFSEGKQTSIPIPFCTYEDIGNYTCTVTDSRKNITVFNSTTFLSVPGPPVIVNSSIVKHTSKAECLLSVEFYSFDEKSEITWYKNGRLLHSSEHQRPNVRPTTHTVNMHNIEVPVKAKIATLQLKPGCDVDTSIYRLTVKTNHFSTSHTFEQDGECMISNQSLYTSNAVVGRRIDTQFYEEIDMFIENLRQADEETTEHNRYTMTENEYEQIPFDIN
ncbi:TTN [Mytilus coruscus]|uniref:TTN n=1 Tax=Mytilus coruscus TaxID=42192 RepID=A0A6J8BYG2_MYTCO|nr:TTN [Mytilus coruscus]